VVSDGEQALQYLRREGEFAGARRPDLVLLDLNLPRLSGIELLTVVKKDEDLRTIPVIVLTTSTNEDDVLNSYHHHANAYVTKPVNVEELFDVIRAFELFWLAIVTLPPE
jgi:CheY-like chemotaxis protein